jgi:hypothetical protein
MNPSGVDRDASRADALQFGMAPGIRFTLLTLYLALVLPLPWMAPQTLRLPLLLAVPLGMAIVLAISSERVELTADGIQVAHPAWCAWWLKRGWSLPWRAISGLTPVGTSQGGRVFYLRTRGSGQAYLLPQRIERFDVFLEQVGRLGGLDCAAVGRLTPPWTYRLLAVLSAILLLVELIVMAGGIPGLEPLAAMGS